MHIYMQKYIYTYIYMYIYLSIALGSSKQNEYSTLLVNIFYLHIKSMCCIK